MVAQLGYVAFGVGDVAAVQSATRPDRAVLVVGGGLAGCGFRTPDAGEQCSVMNLEVRVGQCGVRLCCAGEGDTVEPLSLPDSVPVGVGGGAGDVFASSCWARCG